MVGSKENYKFDQGVKRLIIIPCSSYSLMKKISFFFLTYCDPFLINSLSIETFISINKRTKERVSNLGRVLLQFSYCRNLPLTLHVLLLKTSIFTGFSALDLRISFNVSLS